MTGQTAGVSQPANYMYDGTWYFNIILGVHQLNLVTVLKDASGNVIDAVASNGFTFPATSGVTSADWSGSIPSSGGTCGIRLNGADNNLSTDYSPSSATNTQDPNTC